MVRASQFVAGHKQTVEKTERITERERVWLTHRAATVDPPAKPDFDKFWDGQNGIRGLFVMDNVMEVPSASAFKEYGRALEWGYPMGVGYRYLTLSQSYLLLRLANLPDEAHRLYFSPKIARSSKNESS